MRATVEWGITCILQMRVPGGGCCRGEAPGTWWMHSLRRCEGRGGARRLLRARYEARADQCLLHVVGAVGERGSGGRESRLRVEGLKECLRGFRTALPAQPVWGGMRPRRAGAIDDVRPLRLRVPESLRASPPATNGACSVCPRRGHDVRQCKRAAGARHPSPPNNRDSFPIVPSSCAFPARDRRT